MTTSDSERWDQIHQKTKDDDGHSKYAEEKEKQFPRQAMIIDIGGGTGADAIYFLKQGHSVLLLDISKFAISAATQKINKLDLNKNFAAKECDYGLDALPVKDNSADIVYSRISLNYFDMEHTARLFMDVNRVLKNGGEAFISFKSPKDEEEMEYLKKMTVLYEPNVFIENGMLRSRFSIEQLKRILDAAQIKGYSVKPFHEEIGTIKEHLQTLYLNEVHFKKLG